MNPGHVRGKELFHPIEIFRLQFNRIHLLFLRERVEFLSQHLKSSSFNAVRIRNVIPRIGSRSCDRTDRKRIIEPAGRPDLGRIDLMSSMEADD